MKPMLLVDKGKIVGTCVNGRPDFKTCYGLNGKKVGAAWTRSQTWFAAEMVRGRRIIAREIVAKMASEVPRYEAMEGI